MTGKHLLLTSLVLTSVYCPIANSTLWRVTELPSNTAIVKVHLGRKSDGSYASMTFPYDSKKTTYGGTYDGKVNEYFPDVCPMYYMWSGKTYYAGGYYSKGQSAHVNFKDPYIAQQGNFFCDYHGVRYYVADYFGSSPYPGSFTISKSTIDVSSGVGSASWSTEPVTLTGVRISDVVIESDRPVNINIQDQTYHVKPSVPITLTGPQAPAGKIVQGELTMTFSGSSNTIGTETYNIKFSTSYL